LIKNKILQQEIHNFSTRCVALCHYLGIVQYIAYNFDVYRTRILAHC